MGHLWGTRLEGHWEEGHHQEPRGHRLTVTPFAMLLLSPTQVGSPEPAGRWGARSYRGPDCYINYPISLHLILTMPL